MLYFLNDPEINEKADEVIRLLEEINYGVAISILELAKEKLQEVAIVKIN